MNLSATKYLIGQNKFPAQSPTIMLWLQRFAAVIIRIREPKTTALVFASGKMVSLLAGFCKLTEPHNLLLVLVLALNSGHKLITHP